MGMKLLAAWQWFFLIYFFCLNSGYLLLNIISILSVTRYMQQRLVDMLPKVYSGFELPISVIIPAYNEEITIESTIRSVMQLNYPEYEILVVNDGSTDNSMDILIEKFSLKPFPEAYRLRIPVKPVRTVYHSTVYPNLRVLDKENGGKSDALNAGINASRYPLFCCIDADSILQRDSLHKVVQPFLENPDTIAAGGTIRIANGCEVRDGFLVSVGLPGNILVLIQIVEYLRAFLFGRLGWAPLNALLIISGAFSLFRKETVIKVGGYNTETVGEDMELVVRLHRFMKLESKKYHITFVPDPICWTEAPEDLTTLKNQRIRWQRGLSESLVMNRKLLFHRKSGTVGWIAFPFMLVFEWMGPLVEVSGYAFMVIGFMTGLISLQVFAVFLLLAFAFSLLISITALILEEISFHLYTKPRHLFTLFFAVLIENLGYRQIIAFWRLLGLVYWALGVKSNWGQMVRRAEWQQERKDGAI